MGPYLGPLVFFVWSLLALWAHDAYKWLCYAGHFVKNGPMFVSQCHVGPKGPIEQNSSYFSFVLL